MKKITQSATTGGAPIYLDDFKDVFNDEIWDILQAKFAAFDTDAEGIIVQGCNIGGSGPSSYTISGGIVYLDGEFRRLSAATGLSLPQYIIAATDVNTTRTFEDTVVKTLFVTKSAELDTSAPGSGQYIAITSTTDPDNRRFDRPMVSNTFLRTKVVEIGDWNMNSGTGTPGVQVPHGLSISQIRNVSGLIRNDAGTELVVAGGGGGASTIIQNVDATYVTLLAGTNQSSGTDYDSTGYNRGWVTIVYGS